MQLYLRPTLQHQKWYSRKHRHANIETSTAIPYVKEQPESYPLIGDLALTEMKLGENASAMTLADRGLAVNPIEKDALTGPWSLEVFARVTAATGDHDRSIAALQKLLSIPYEGPLPSHIPLSPSYDSAAT